MRKVLTFFYSSGFQSSNIEEQQIFIKKLKILKKTSHQAFKKSVNFPQRFIIFLIIVDLYETQNKIYNTIAKSILWPKIDT